MLEISNQSTIVCPTCKRPDVHVDQDGRIQKHNKCAMSGRRIQLLVVTK